MTVFKLAGLALVALCGAVLLRAYKPEMGLQLSIAACFVLLSYALTDIAAIRQAVEGVTGRFGLGVEQLKLVSGPDLPLSKALLAVLELLRSLLEGI